ncbi:hypothetical protein [Sideroxydans sp. CL21]|nr:hypothetical protein [Sideroxydans sp. CL21]
MSVEWQQTDSEAVVWIAADERALMPYTIFHDRQLSDKQFENF